MILVEFSAKFITGGKIICPKGWGDLEQSFSFHRLYYILDGEGYYESGGQKLSYKKGYLYLLPINKEYSLSHNDNNPLSVVWFHIDVMPKILNEIVELSPNSYNEMSSLIDILIYYCVRIEGSIHIIENLLSVLICQISGHEKIQTIEDENITKALSYMDENYQKNITNKEIANHIGYNKNYFIRLFNENMSITPHRYIVNYRMQFAAKLIRFGNMSIKEIATRVGFEDAKAFSRKFKKIFLKTPSEFRKSDFVQP